METHPAQHDETRMHLLRCSSPCDLQPVVDFLRTVHVEAHREAGGAVSVSVPGALSELHERREISGYLTTWNVLNPQSPIELIDS
jgi:hypothetical protein